MQGTLHIDVGGAAVKLLQAAQNMTVIVAGTDPANPAEVTVGDGKLSHVQSNVSVTGAELTIDNSTNAAPHIFTMTSNSYTGWSIPNSTFEPTIFLGNALSPLVGELTLLMAAGDQIDIEANPPKIDSLVIDNFSAVRDAIFVVAATCNMAINGDFDLYLGRRLNPDGTSQRTKRLSPISSVRIVFNFSALDSDGTNTIFDGDLDPAGAAYQIDGLDVLHIVNQTENLDVLIEGYRAEDQAYLYLPGGTVNADLTNTSPGIITVDGQARLAGTNPDVANTISASLRAGAVTLDPTGTFDSSMKNYDGGNILFNTVNILGAKPQDTLNVKVPTTTAIAPTSLGTPNTVISIDDRFATFDPYTVVNPPPGAFYIVTGSQPPYDSGPVPRPGLLNDGLLRSLGVDFVDTTLIYQNTDHLDLRGTPLTTTVSVREFPLNSHPQATDNIVNLDASQLRGVFNFNVSEPNYAALCRLFKTISCMASMRR